MSNELVTTKQENPYAIMPVMAIAEAKYRRQMIVDFTRDIMIDGKDFGTIPGAGDKKTLFKAGAEKLTTLFGLSPYFEVVESVTDWTGGTHNGEPFFYFHYRCLLKRGDAVVGTGEGSCNGWEKKYRYRTVYENKATDQQKSNAVAIEVGKGKFGAYRRFVLLNENPADLVNTIKKMAQKRALVAATLIAVNASEFFTQDLEDMDFGVVIEGQFEINQPIEPEKQGGKQPPSQIDLIKPPSPERQITTGSASDFVSMCIDFVKRYNNPHQIKAVLKAYGITAISGNPEERVKHYQIIRDHAELRDKDIPKELCIAVVNGVITEAEALAQSKPADPVRAANAALFPDDSSSGNNYSE